MPAKKEHHKQRGSKIPAKKWGKNATIANSFNTSLVRSSSKKAFRNLSLQELEQSLKKNILFGKTIPPWKNNPNADRFSGGSIYVDLPLKRGTHRGGIIKLGKY